MDQLLYLPESCEEFEAARKRIALTFAGASGPCGPCNQGRIGCKTPEVCFASAPSPIDPVSAPSARSWLRKVADFWHRHVVDHNVWE